MNVPKKFSKWLINDFFFYSMKQKFLTYSQAHFKDHANHLPICEMRIHHEISKQKIIMVNDILELSL